MISGWIEVYYVADIRREWDFEAHDKMSVILPTYLHAHLKISILKYQS